MSTTSQYTRFSDFVTGLLNAVRAQTGVTATENQAKRAINVALQDMHLGTDYKFPWAERHALLLVQPPYSTGTVTVAKGSRTFTGSGTLWNTLTAFTTESIYNMMPNTATDPNSFFGTGNIVVAGSRTPFPITTVNSDTVCTSSASFTGESVSAGSYYWYKDTYTLATDFLRPVDMQVFSQELSIDLISRTEFRRRFPLNTTPGIPSVACIVDDARSRIDGTPMRRVQLSRPPNAFMQIPYSYITGYLAVDDSSNPTTTLVNDNDEPIVPLRYRHALFFHALYNYYRDKKDDSRSQEAKAEYTDVMTRMLMDNEAGDRRPQMAPRTSGYKRAAQSPYGGSTRWRR